MEKYINKFLSDCGDSITVSNGTLKFTTTTVGSIAEVNCNAGYETDNSTISCLETGSWETPNCKIKGSFFSFF